MMQHQQEIIYQSEEAPKCILLQPVDEHDLEVMEQEIAYIKEYSPVPFVLAAIPVDQWNRDLSPWKADPVFGKEPFGDGAKEFLRELEETRIPKLQDQYGDIPLILGGYSLAGLFALWSGYASDTFDGIAAASPSVWFPDFLNYATERKLQTGKVYLSLGDREMKTRNPVMKQVGEKMEALVDHLKEESTDTEVEFQWNRGNHFMDSDLRTAKAFAWVMNRVGDSVKQH